MYTLVNNNCRLEIYCGDKLLRSIPLEGATYSPMNSTSFSITGTTGSLTGDVFDYGYLDLAAFEAEVLPWIEECSQVDVDPVFEYVGVTTTVYCRLTDSKKVIVRTCKLEDGSVEITDTDSGAILTDATLASDYDAECPELKIVDLEETIVMIPLGGGEETLTPPIGYDAISIFNCSPCPVLATITLDADGVLTDNKVQLEPGETRVFDWSCDAIVDFNIGELQPFVGTTASDDLATQAATQDLKIRVTYFNS